MSTPFQITVDCADADRMADFWSQALDYQHLAAPAGFDSWGSFADAYGIERPAPGSIRVIVDPAGAGPTIKFIRAELSPSAVAGFNFELRPGDEEAKEAKITQLRAIGGRLVDRHRSPNGWWAVVADPEGNEFCVI